MLRAIAAGERFGLPRVISIARAQLGLTLYRLGRWDDALSETERA